MRIHTEEQQVGTEQITKKTQPHNKKDPKNLVAEISALEIEFGIPLTREKTGLNKGILETSNISTYKYITGSSKSIYRTVATNQITRNLRELK